MSPATRYDWTYADYARLPDDGNRYEVVDGELLVTPAPSPMHQHILARMVILLTEYAEAEAVGLVLPDVDLLFASGHFLRPDLVFVPNASRPAITNRGVEEAPELVVEILSPTSHAIDRVKKPARYGDFGVPEYWVVDPEEQVVWAWRLSDGATQPERLTDSIEWRPAGARAPFVLELEELFRPM